MPSRWALALLLLLPLVASTSSAGAAALDPAGARRAWLERDLEASGRPDLAEAWVGAIRAEREANDISDEDPERAEARFLEAIRNFEAVAAERQRDGTAHWRSARAHWLLGEMYPVEEKERRLAHFTASVELASRGIELDPRCAECMLWKFTSMGRVSTTKGLLSGLLDASEMAELLEEGIALAPTHHDHANNSALGNLHYGSAVFYRVLPDWRWLGWMIGVRGDKERALAHARQAVSLHPGRLDYRVEVGSQLLCLGSKESQPQRLEEGSALLEGLLTTGTKTIRDERHLAAARVMLETPSKSCGYSGDTWIEIDASDAASVGSRTD